MSRLTIEIIVSIAFLVFSSLSIRSCNRHKAESQRWEQNTIALSSDIEHYKTESGKSATVAQGLQLSLNSLEDINSELYAELEDTRVKLKNAQSVIKVVTDTEYINGDTVFVDKHEGSLVLDHTEPWVHIYANVDIDAGLIKPSDLRVELPNEITLITETITKRRWIFWKKPIGVQVTVVNSNPHVGVSEVFYVDLIE